jgi:hypothetical protein
MPLPILENARIWLALFLRVSAANNGPNLFHQNRAVSWLMSMPRSCKCSSTFLSEMGDGLQGLGSLSLANFDWLLRPTP